MKIKSPTLISLLATFLSVFAFSGMVLDNKEQIEYVNEARMAYISSTGPYVARREYVKLVAQRLEEYEILDRARGTNDSLAAFLGCEGFGCTALASCRDSIIAGTKNLSNWPVNASADGFGSYKAALDSAEANPTDAHNIYGTVGGLINWDGITSQDLSFDLKCTWINLQTAQGEGLTITPKATGAQSNSSGAFVRGSRDILLRGFRGRKAINGAIPIIFGGSKIAYANISAQWAAQQSGGNIWRGASGDTATESKVGKQDTVYHHTYQWGLVGEPDFQHPTLCAIAAEPIAAPGGGNWTMTRMLFVGAGHRTCITRGGTPPNAPGNPTPVSEGPPRAGMNFINNVIYNWDDRAHEAAAGQSMSDVVNNWFKDGPQTPLNDVSSLTGFFKGSPIQLGDGCNLLGVTTTDGYCSKSIHVNKIMHRRTNYDPNLSLDAHWEGPLRLVVCRDSNTTEDPVITLSRNPFVCGARGETVDPIVRRDTALTPSQHPVIPLSLDSASFLKVVGDSAGYSWGVKCSGERESRRDSVDAAIVARMVGRTSLIGGGHGRYVDVDTMTISTPASGTACADTDNDDLPDDWEIIEFGNLTQLTRADTVGPSGYLAFELYAEGKSFNFGGTLPPPPPPPPPPADENTFGDGRRIHYVPAVVETLGFFGGSFIRRTPNTDSFPEGIGNVIRWLDPVDSLRFLVGTYDTAATGVVPIDSITADSIANDWNIPIDTLRFRTITISFIAPGSNPLVFVFLPILIHGYVWNNKELA